MEAAGLLVPSGICCQEAYGNYTRCDRMGSDLLGHSIIFSRQRTLKALSYIDEILTSVVLPMLSCRTGALYRQDKARPHTSQLTQQCLQGYDVLLWLPGHQAFRQYSPSGTCLEDNSSLTRELTA
ncbi:hypothetical protein TNCV_4166711 [Trichonephila clavipes]|nr:hypothetical protein TNCV_4166711 [Trichonephila clavipes]